jgi:hypothetical protein
MKTVKFDFKLIDLDGTIIEAFDVKKEIANMMASSAHPNFMRVMEIAKVIYSNGEVELVSEDVELIKAIISSNDRITALVKEQLTNALK